MKLKYFQIVQTREALDKLSKTKIKIKEAVEVARLIKKISQDLEIYEKQRIELCEKFGTKDEQKNIFTFSDEKLPKFIESMDELGEIETENDYVKVKINSDIELEAADVIKLENIVDFGE